MNHIPPRSLSRVAVGTGALALTLATCSACVGGSTASGGPTSSAAGSAVTSASATGIGPSGGAAPSTAAGGGASATDTAPGSGNTGAPGGPQACETQNLSGTVGDGNGAAGSAYYDVVFENIGNTPCTIYGYPGVSVGAGSPVQQVGQPASRNPQVNPMIVTLIPNAHAYAILRITDALNYPAGDCDPKPVTSLRVYPPNNKTLLYIPLSTTTCSSKLVTMAIEAVQPGTGA